MNPRMTLLTLVSPAGVVPRAAPLRLAVKRLRALGFDIPLLPQGAFYLYANCSRFTHDSQAFCLELLEQAGVAITPGLDFGDYLPQRHVRISYANTLEKLQEGIRRMAQFLQARH